MEWDSRKDVENASRLAGESHILLLFFAQDNVYCDN